MNDEIPQRFAIELSHLTNEECVVALSGELDLAGSHELSRCLSAFSSIVYGRVLVDLRDLTFIDATGVEALGFYDPMTRRYHGGNGACQER